MADTANPPKFQFDELLLTVRCKGIDFPGYRISIDGRVWSDKTSRFLRPSFLNGYPYLNLRGPDKSYFVFVHQAVAATFIGDRPAGMDVCHTDGDRSNSRLSNLRYGTKLANADDKKRHGRDVLRIEIVETRPGTVKLGLTGPPSFVIVRDELVERGGYVAGKGRK